MPDGFGVTGCVVSEQSGVHPCLDATIQDRDPFNAGRLQRPIDTRRRTKIRRVGAEEGYYNWPAPRHALGAQQHRQFAVRQPLAGIAWRAAPQWIGRTDSAVDVTGIIPCPTCHLPNVDKIDLATKADQFVWRDQRLPILGER